MKTRLLPALAVCALYVLHQDLWLWRTARPLVFGFLPVGMAYHALYCLAAAALMWWLTTIAWPWHLEANGADVSARPTGQPSPPGPGRSGGRRRSAGPAERAGRGAGSTR